MSYDRIIRDALRLARTPRRFASGGDAEPFHPIGSKKYTENLMKFAENNHLVDKSGNPIRLYHGTSDQISYFNIHHKNRKDAGWLGEGVYLTESPMIASNYATQKRGDADPNVMPLFARITNPYKATTKEKNQIKQIEFSLGKEAAQEYSRNWTNDLKSKGHDGVIYEGPIKGMTEYVIFEPENVKSAIGNRGTFDTSSDFIDRADGGAVGYASGGDTTPPRQLNDMGFYSSAAESARSLPQSKGTPQQMLATMKGVKPAELEWSGVQDKFADQKSVTKDDLAQHFEQNVPEIKETVLGGKIDPKILKRRNEIKDMYWPEISRLQEMAEPDAMLYAGAVERLMHGHMDREAPLPSERDPVKYHEYTVGHHYDDESVPTSLIPTANRNYREILLHLPGEKKFQSSHWDPENILAHLRMQDRGPDNDILHLEELQSDWAQKGRDEGFDTKEMKEKREFAKNEFNNFSKELAKKYGLNSEQNLALYGPFKGMSHDEVEEYVKLRSEVSQLGGFNNTHIEPAPYVTNTDHWMELGLKRALLETARGGYNKLVWTPGEEQAKRYDLRKDVHEITWNPYDSRGANKIVTIYAMNGNPIELPVDLNGKVIKNAGTQFDGKHITEIVGREIGNKILNGRFGDLSGDGLKVGGEGMKSFYDKMLPAALRRVLKPHTDKIQPTSHVVKGNDGEDVTLPGIEITPEVRESILKKGFSYYARGGEVRQHFEVGGGADSGSDSGGGFEGSGGGFEGSGGGGDSAPEATQDSPAFSTEASPSYSSPESDPSMLGGATGMAFSPSGSGSLGVGTGNTSGSFLGAAEQQLNTGPGIVGFLGGTPMGLMALGAEKLNEAARAQGYDVVDPGGARPGRGTEQAAREQAAYEAGFPGNRAGGNDSGMIPDPVAPEPSFYGFRLSNDDEETQAGMVRPVGFTPPKPPMMASGGSVPMASGGEVEDQMTGRPLSDKETKDLVGKIQSVLTPDLLEPKYRKQSEGQHPTFGHCASATQAAYYMLGGKESGYVPQVAKEDGGTTHWWLKHRQTGHVIDPTKEQYTSQGEKPPYDRGRGCGFPNPNPDAPSRRGQEIIDRIQRRYEMGEAVPMASGGEVGDNSPMPMTPDQQRMLDDLSAALDRAAARYGTTGYAADPAAQQSPAPRHEPTMPGEPALTRGQEQEYHIGQLQNALARVPTDYPTGPVGYAEGGDVGDNPAVQKALAVTSGVPATSGAAANFIQNTSNPKRIMVPATGPGGIKGIVIPRHMWEGGNGKHGLIPGLRDINQARAAVYGSQNRDPLTIGRVAETHKQTLDEHFKRPVDEQIARENEALERLRAAKHIGKSADTLDESEKLDTVRHEYDDQGRPHVGYGSKGVAGYALYSSGHGSNQKFHVLNVCPGSVAGCSGGIDANGIADTSRGTCFAPVAESQYPGAAIRRACHAQAKFDPAMTSDWILAHTGSLRRAAERADKNGERVLFRPNVVDESDRSSRYAIKHLNDQRKAYSESAKLNLPLPDIIANSYGKTTELHDPDNGFFVTYSNTGPKTKLGYSVSENIQRDKQRVRSTILAQDAAGRDFVNDDGEETPPKGSYMVTDVKRDSPLDEKMRKAFKYAKYWSVGRPVSSLSKDEAAEGEEAHYDGKGKPTTPEKAHYGHVTLNGKRYDYQKQHILHRRLVQVGKNKDGSPHMIPTDSRFKDEEFLPSTRYMTRSGKPAGHILITTPTTSTSNAGHQTAFTHHVNESHIAHASKNKGEYEIDPPAAQEASAGKEYAPPKDVGHFAYGGTVDDEIGEHLMAFPERSHYAQIHNVHRSRHNDEKEIGSKRSHGIKSIDRALRLTSQYNQPTRGRP